MAFFEWDDTLTLGDPVIDRQHKRLVDLINKISECSDSPDRDAQIMHCLTSMYLYAKEHFFDEEGFMTRLSYPDRARHAELHQEFVQKTNDLTDACLTDSMLYPDLLEFLVSWLRGHITVEDARIMAFVKDKRAG
ncbi:MAG: hemerythrin family protein [Humidesulfovibrio sp.]|nr:hypothetical protein [Desulfovibrio sp.]MDO9083497.1 hemerythrin family protein [Humidesulfovibrio sp.]